MEHFAEEKLKCLEYFSTSKNLSETCEKFNVKKSSVYRWKKQYDGTLQSLENKPHTNKTPNPKALTEEEKSTIIMLHEMNPHISDREICKHLKKYRSSVTINRYRKKLCNREFLIPKYEITAMFMEANLNKTNEKYLYEMGEDHYWIIELNDLGIYIAEQVNKNPASLTMYYSLAKKFSKEKLASDFIKKCNSKKFRLKAIRIERI